MTIDSRELTPEVLDRLFAALEPPKRDRMIWSAHAIGRRIGRSESWVRKHLVHVEGNPIRRTSTNRLYAFEEELLDFWRRRRIA